MVMVVRRMMMMAVCMTVLFFDVRVIASRVGVGMMMGMRMRMVNWVNTNILLARGMLL